jgi:tRNA pseudouridine55 synthase
MTSHDVVAIVRKTLGERGIGHLGTLDPAATGLLVLAVGRKALKVVELFNALSKEYEAHVKFGQVSTTYDGEGVLETPPPRPGWEIPEQATVQRAIRDHFVGRISQVPPAHSAISINGVRAYDLARSGKDVEMPVREVEITSCDITKYDYPNLFLTVCCGSGTYIRSLAHDLGKLLWCGGYLKALRRTKLGEWSVKQGIDPKAAMWGHVLPLKDVLAPLPRRDFTDDEWDDVQHGRVIEATVEQNTIGWKDGLPVAILVPAGEGMAKGRKVFGGDEGTKGTKATKGAQERIDPDFDI